MLRVQLSTVKNGRSEILPFCRAPLSPYCESSNKCMGFPSRFGKDAKRDYSFFAAKISIGRCESGVTEPKPTPESMDIPQRRKTQYDNWVAAQELPRLWVFPGA